MKAAHAMRVLARVAETQDGLVTTSQAAHAGVPRLSLARLAESGDLERLAHGVYRVRGADEDEYTDLRAAWLAADPRRTAAERAADLGHAIVVSHRSAAAVHGIGHLYADRHELTAPVRKQSRRQDVAYHRAAVPPADVVVREGMLVTSVERTIADLARVEPELGDVADALADAQRQGKVDLERLVPMLDEAAGRHGARDGADLLDRMLELKGGDIASAFRRIAENPAVRESLAKAWTPAIESLLASTYARSPLRTYAEYVPSLAVPDLDKLLPDVRRFAGPLAEAATSARGLEVLEAELMSPSLRASIEHMRSAQRAVAEAARAIPHSGFRQVPDKDVDGSDE